MVTAGHVGQGFGGVCGAVVVQIMAPLCVVLGRVD